MTTAPAIASRTARLIARRSGGRIEREIDWTTPIDRSRWFICETLTPLYYTSLYSQLTLEQRRRYNQLTGMFANELIAFLEREFLDAVLKAVSEAPAAATPWDPLRDALAAFRDDEREHALLWQRLNHLSEPDRYVPGVRMFLHVPRAAGALGRLATRQPAVFPVVFWVQLLQEERSIEISRRCSRLPADAIEPRYAAVYRAHLRDEVRHVRIDRLPPEAHEAGHFLDHRGRARHGTGDHVGMAVEVLRGAADDHVRAVLDRAEIDRARERRVHQQGEPMLARGLRHRFDVEHPH